MFYLAIVKIVFSLLFFSSLIMPFSKKVAKLYFDIFGDTFIGNMGELFSNDKELEAAKEEKEWVAIGLLFFWVCMIFVSLIAAFLWPILLIYLLVYKFIL